MSAAVTLKKEQLLSDEVDECTELELRGFAGEDVLRWEQMLHAPVRWPSPSRLDQPLKLSGNRAIEGMLALGVRTVGDLLEHLPRDTSETRTIGTLRLGEQATIAVTVSAIERRPVRRGKMRPLVEATVRDESGSMRATFFNQPWLVDRYPPGTKILLHGKAETANRFSVSHHALGNEAAIVPTAAVSHYRASEGINSTQILTLVQGARAALADVCETLPAKVRVAHGLPDKGSALAAMHFPRDQRDLEDARRRLAFDELFLAQLAFLRRRSIHRQDKYAHALTDPPSRSARWLEHELPFPPTDDQRTAMAELDADLVQPRPMQRLLMGEVGSGKTVVALYAMLRAIENGHQSALMAPTETLAEQHFATLQKLITAEPVASALLTGSTPSRRRADILGKLRTGELSLVVGTHALIEPSVTFRSLALVVVDEQHRFGVRQRAALHRKGGADDPTDVCSPHLLHMTATPIPRTLALARYGDLDVSTLRELPRGRQRIDTCIVSTPTQREDAYRALRDQLDAGRQAYVVCPLIEQGDSDGEEVRAASEEFKRLAATELSGYRLVLMHGQMASRDKQQAMASFAEGEADVLISTTVIEVGIDVPNATVMVVENADRFGISQLHQLRGRIGRGEHPSTCMLMGPAESGRLRALARHSDGFRLAEIDLALRKEGELVGTRQSGMGHFRVALLPDDKDLLEGARAQAEEILETDELLDRAEHVLLDRELRRQFGEFAFEPIPV